MGSSSVPLFKDDVLGIEDRASSCKPNTDTEQGSEELVSVEPHIELIIVN